MYNWNQIYKYNIPKRINSFNNDYIQIKMSTKKTFTKEKYSKKHHYLPVFYLKGFTDNNGLINVYDKVKDIILINQKPESKFYENNLNNYKFDGEIKFTLEEPVFTPLDTESSILFEKIRNQEFSDEKQLTPSEKFQILGFITRLFWRSPESNNLFAEIIKKEGLSNKYFGFYRKGESESIPDEEIIDIKNQFLSDKEIQKVFKHAIPLSNGTQEEIYRLYHKWNLFSLKVKTPNIITGDSPFLINNEDIRLDNIFDELIFPIGKHKLLSLSNKAPNFLDAILMTHVNVSILHQSKRFIASDNAEQLKELLVHYNALIQQNLAKPVVENTFKIMNYQSNFKSHMEYYKEYMNAKEIYLKVK